MKIRNYTAADKEKVVGLFRMNTPQYFAPGEENDLLYYLEQESENYFVLEDDSMLIGCGGFNFSEDKTMGRISWDFFHPEQQGKGLGSMLLQFRIEKLKEYENVKIISVRTSQMAFRFYEKSGFELKETVKDYWAKGFDLYRMEILL
jgi:ribosomal protein S18 acetylase RimI-like enzyme